MKTVAESLGGTTHISPLLRKARQLGLEDGGDLLRVAVSRGCRHYTPAGYDEVAARERDPGEDIFSNAELSVAMISAAQTYDPQLTRCAAQLMSSPGIHAHQLARLAIMERCAPIVRHIGEAALRYDRGHEGFWREVLTVLPAARQVRRGVLPHPSRFVSASGFRRGHAGGHIVWLRGGSAGPGRVDGNAE